MGYESLERLDTWMKRHRGDHSDFLAFHRKSVSLALKAGKAEVAQLVSKLFGRVCDFRMLRCAWAHVSTFGGSAPGIDGETYEDYFPYCKQQPWGRIGQLGEELRTACYQPLPLRDVKIPKSSGNGYRTLRIPSIWDRVVQRAVLEVVQPIMEPSFDDNSFGWRPNRTRGQAVNLVRKLTAKEGRRIWVCEDISNCFEHIPRKRLFDVLKKHFPSEDLLGLLQTLIGKDKKCGLPQGGPLMPFLVNVYLDHFLDRQWRKQCPDIPLVRVADDILLLCRTEAEALQAQQTLRSMLTPAGLQLKGNSKSTRRNLAAGEAAVWLGLLATCNEKQLIFEVAERGWNKLRDNLAVVALEYNPEVRACNVIEGWVAQAVACGVTVDIEEASEIIIDELYELDLQRITHPEAIRRLWNRDNSLWDKVRKNVETRNAQVKQQTWAPSANTDEPPSEECPFAS
jgi:group II intron reverse transcriptase/maturase